MTLGIAAAVVFLAGASVWLLSTPDTSAKVLVAIWLWSLPALGFGALAGWLAGRIVRRLSDPGGRP